VDDIGVSVERALAAGGHLDREVTRHFEPGGGCADVANLSDPAGNGVDLAQRLDYELRPTKTDEEWDAYHSIRERVLFEARGRFGEYDRSHPDEHRDGNHPFLLVFEGEPIGVVRVDVAGGTAFFRRVAIREALQRNNHGRTMLFLAERFARAQGCRHVCSDVDADAVEFYRKVGHQESDTATAGNSVAMRKTLSR
jgi:GNAT superfamily N-acetyltransferase